MSQFLKTAESGSPHTCITKAKLKLRYTALTLPCFTASRTIGIMLQYVTACYTMLQCVHCYTTSSVTVPGGQLTSAYNNKPVATHNYDAESIDIHEFESQVRRACSSGFHVHYLSVLKIYEQSTIDGFVGWSSLFEFCLLVAVAAGTNGGKFTDDRRR